METPTAWLATGWHSASSELFVTSPGIVEATGGPIRFFQEHPCESYTTDTRVGADPVLVGGTEIWIDSLTRSASAMCRDRLGARQPIVEVMCSGLGSLGAAP
jgi:hypothetical protein